MYHANAAAALRPPSPYGLPIASPAGMFRSPFHHNLAHLVSAAASAGSAAADPGRSPSDRGASRVGGANPSSIPHHGGLKQEKPDKSLQHSPSKQHHHAVSAAAAHHNKEPHIKKPLNAFMLYMKEMRPVVQAECTLKESAAINQILGRRVSMIVTVLSILVVCVIVNVTSFVASVLGQKKFINQ